MEQQLATNENKNLAVKQWSDEDLGMDNLVTQDVTPPRILLMQPMSEMLQDEKLDAKAGQIRESVEGKKLGGNGTPVKVVPFFTTNTWVIRRKVGEQYEYVGVEDRTAQNAYLEFQYTQDGIEYKREKTMNVFCFLYDDVLAGKYVPYIASFQRTSFTTAGKKLSQLMTLLKGSKRALWSCVLELDSEKKTNDANQSYYTFKLTLAKEQGKELTLSIEQQNEAYTNYLAVREAYNQGKIKKHVDDETSVSSDEDIPF